MKLKRILSLLGILVFVSISLFLLLTPVPPAAAATCTWNGSSGNWSDTSKWSCGAAPGAGDTAVINAGTVTADTPLTVGTLNMNGGVVTGASTLTVTNSLSWQNGDFLYTNVFSKLVIGGGATAVFNRPMPVSPPQLNWRPFDNFGVIQVTDTSWGMANLSNYGVVELDNGWLNMNPAGGTLINNGVLRTAAGTYNFGPKFVTNNGQIIINQGQLNTVTNSSYNNANGASITLNDGVFILDTLMLNGGSLRGTGMIYRAWVRNLNGVVTPGNPYGALIIMGKGLVPFDVYEQGAGGVLSIHVNGNDLSNSGRLIISMGRAKLAGTLNIIPAANYSPAAVDGFKIMQYSSRFPGFETFTTVNNPLAAGHPVAYTAMELTLGGRPQETIRAGDILAAVGAGKIKRFNPDGVLLDILDSDAGYAPDPFSDPPFFTGENSNICLDGNGRVHEAMFNYKGVSQWDSAGHLITTTLGSTLFSKSPEACGFDRDGNLFVGVNDAIITNNLFKLSPAGAILAGYTVNAANPVLPDGVNNLDTAADGCTLYYTDSDPQINRFNTCTATDLPPLITNLPATRCHEVRLRPNGELLVGCTSGVYRVSSSGVLLASYTTTTLGLVDSYGIYSVILDKDGTTFWTSGHFGGELMQVNIASGAVLRRWPSQPFITVTGLAQMGGTVAGRPSLALVSTVSSNIGSCGASNTLSLPAAADVTFCYRLTNTGAITLTTHTLTNTLSGVIYTNQPITLGPGQSTQALHTANVAATTLNQALWTAVPTIGSTPSAPAWSRVTIGVTIPDLDEFVYLPLVIR